MQIISESIKASEATKTYKYVFLGSQQMQLIYSVKAKEMF